MNFDTMMHQLRTDYVKSIPEKIQIIRHFYNSGDHLGVKEVFHKLKGTGSTYGVPEITALGETLERFCLDNPKAMKEAIPDAMEILNQVHTYRLENKEFDLESDQRYIRIRGLLKR